MRADADFFCKPVDQLRDEKNGVKNSIAIYIYLLMLWSVWLCLCWLIYGQRVRISFTLDWVSVTLSSKRLYGSISA